MLSTYMVQAVSPPIGNKPEELIAQATSPTALSNSPWPIAYPNSMASAMPLNPQQLSTTQAASYLNQTQATSALPFTGSIPKESNPLPTNNLGFPNFWNPLNFQYPYLHRNIPSAAMQVGMPPVPTEWPINSHVTPFSSPFRLNLAEDANRLQYLRRNRPVAEKQITEKTAPTGLFNRLHRVIQGMANTRLSAQGSDANSHRLNNSGYDKTTTME